MLKTKHLAILSIVLWVATIAFGSYYFVFGKVKISPDKRIEIQLTPQERNLVLKEMRTLLVEFQKILDKLARDDIKGIAENLSNMGMKMAADDSEVLLGKLPLAFKSMGLGLHRRMDELAVQVKSGKMGKKQLIKALSSAVSTCVSCHEAYRISLEPTIKK